MEKISFADKLYFFKKSLLKNSPVLLIGSLFMLFGIAIIYFNFRYEKTITLYIISAFVILLPLFGILYTFPSSYMYYYEQEITKKYGYYTKATIVNKEIEDTSYFEASGIIGEVGHKREKIEEYNYIISYAFNYKKITYSNSFYVDDKTVFDKLELQSLIPIKFLKTDPKKATVLMKNLNK